MANLAIDAELERQPVPRALARRAGVTDPAVFWPLWTRAETRAKLHGIPILRWLRCVDWVADADLETASEVERAVSVTTMVRDGVVVSYGALADQLSSRDARRRALLIASGGSMSLAVDLAAETALAVARRRGDRMASTAR